MKRIVVDMEDPVYMLLEHVALAMSKKIKPRVITPSRAATSIITQYMIDHSGEIQNEYVTIEAERVIAKVSRHIPDSPIKASRDGADGTDGASPDPPTDPGGGTGGTTKC